MDSSLTVLIALRRVLNSIAALAGIGLIIIFAAGRITPDSNAPTFVTEALANVPTRDEPLGLVLFIVGLAIMIGCATATTIIGSRLRSNQRPSSRQDLSTWR